MDWKNSRRSDNVEDRRGFSGTTAGGIGLGGLVIILIGWMFGIDPGTMLQFLEGSQSQSQYSSAGAPPANDEAGQFLSTVLASTEDVWKPVFRQHGKTYHNPKLVLFSGQVQSACGVSSSATGPFYCSADQKLYIDPSFYREMQKMGASGEFAFAYVVAHEVGHHVQNLLGTLGQAHRYMRQVSKTEANQISVRIELQADCFAGIWAKDAQRQDLLEEGDIEEAINAAEAVGDDTLQKRSQGYAVPDSFTHGSSAQRMYWFKRGFESGDINRCNTFDN